MSETQHGSFTFTDFRLQSGEVMPEVTHRLRARAANWHRTGATRSW